MLPTPPDSVPVWMNVSARTDCRELILLDKADFESAKATWPANWQAQSKLAGFNANPGQNLMLSACEGRPDTAIAGVSSTDSWFATGRGLPARLPAGDYTLTTLLSDDDLRQFYTGFGTGAYSFDRYKTGKDLSARPTIGRVRADLASEILAQVYASNLVRDLVNTPASHMGPAELEAAIRQVADQFGARVNCICGDDLLANSYPAVHAVGRAASEDRAPRMIEMTWGKNDHPRLCLIGKGVSFDTGGLDLKPSAGMRWMKKDMGGAAHALGLAWLIMEARLPVQLTLLVPAVENAVSGNAMRPGDILDSRSGKTIEVGNTDAEGRLILADALTRACELDPVLTIDLATLTGAARVAMGPEIVPFFSSSDQLAAQLTELGRKESDPVWQLPLWPGYESALSSDIADLKNDPSAWAQAGCITAALFLKEFAPKTDWLHLDVFAWNSNPKPGRPGGAETQSIRALYRLISQRFIPA